MNTRILSTFGKIAVVAMVAGAAGSLGMVLHAGRHNSSLLLVILFVGWVLSPYVGLTACYFVAPRWSSATRKVFYSLMILLSIGSLVVYSGLLTPAGAKPAGVFLSFPLFSWLAMAIIMPITGLVAKRRSGLKDDE